MEDLLKQIVNITELKRSFSIVVSDHRTRFKTFPNIDRSNNCFTYSSGANATWFDIIIPEGSYHVEDINEFIQREMRKMTTMIKQTI